MDVRGQFVGISIAGGRGGGEVDYGEDGPSLGIFTEAVPALIAVLAGFVRVFRDVAACDAALVVKLNEILKGPCRRALAENRDGGFSGALLRVFIRAVGPAYIYNVCILRLRDQPDRQRRWRAELSIMWAGIGVPSDQQ